MSTLDTILLAVGCLIALNAVFFFSMLLWKRSERKPRPVRPEEWRDMREWDWPRR